MKHFYVLLFLLFANSIVGQNLVIDPSLDGHSTGGCDYNNIDTKFNSTYSNATSFHYLVLGK